MNNTFTYEGALWQVENVNVAVGGLPSLEARQVSLIDHGYTMCKCSLSPVKKTSPIKKVVFNCPATIVYWTDGTKTVVKVDGEEFDPEKGLAMAIAKKHLGNKGNYFNEFKKWIK